MPTKRTPFTIKTCCLKHSFTLLVALLVVPVAAQAQQARLAEPQPKPDAFRVTLPDGRILEGSIGKRR